MSGETPQTYTPYPEPPAKKRNDLAIELISGSVGGATQVLIGQVSHYTFVDARCCTMLIVRMTDATIAFGYTENGPYLVRPRQATTADTRPESPDSSSGQVQEHIRYPQADCQE